MPDVLSAAAASAAAKAVTDLLDAGSGPGRLIIYDATAGVPETVAEPAKGLMLAALPLSKPAFGAGPEPGERESAAIRSAAAAETGTAAYFRLADSNGVAVIQGSVGTADADLCLKSIQLQAGADVAVAGITYTQPG